MVDKITERLDKIIVLLEAIARPPSLTSKLLAGAATGVGILGILSTIDIINSPYARTVKAIADYTDEDGFTRILYLFTFYICVNPQKSVKSVFKFVEIYICA